MNGAEYRIDWQTGEFICIVCGRRFPTHYRLTPSIFSRQLGRRYVSGQNNFFRHLASHKKLNQ